MRIAVIACLLALLTQPVAAADIDDVLQFLAWSANTSDYNMSKDTIEKPLHKEHNGVWYEVREANPMFAGKLDFARTFFDMKNAFVELIPDILPKPWSTLVLLGIFLETAGAVINNNQVLATVGEPIQFTLAFRYRW